MRSLILAGGGIKVGFQAGVLQVWLDEAGLQFDHADGASGGCLNLAMYCQGLSGAEIAENWRRSEPLAGVDLNWQNYGKLFHGPSLFTLDRYRENVLRGAWNLDWNAIRSSQRLGTFNLCNFTNQRLEVVENRDMDEDRLCASVSLPMWFPPVVIDGQTYVDAVYLTDANVEEAIRRGATEIWAIWTVSTDPIWRDGFLAQYFQIIEIAANGRFFDIWRRIDASNRAIAAGGDGEFGRHIEQHLLQAEVPIHYLLNFSRDRMAETVNLGIERARQWCRDEGIGLAPGPPVPAPAPPAERAGIRFTEEMKGHVTPGVDDPSEGSDAGGRERAMFHLTIIVEDIDRFATHPDHEAPAEGWVEVPSLGGRRDAESGRFQLFVDDPDPTRKEMRYRLFFKSDGGEPFTLSGTKFIRDDPGLDAWEDTTTLFVRILHGHVGPGDEAAAGVWGAGVLEIHTVDLVRQLASMRAHGPDLAARVDASRRFSRLFLGKLWDVYAQMIVPFGPI